MKGCRGPLYVKDSSSKGMKQEEVPYEDDEENAFSILEAKSLDFAKENCDLNLKPTKMKLKGE